MTWLTRPGLLIRSNRAIVGEVLVKYARHESTVPNSLPPLPPLPHRTTISKPLPWLSLAEIDGYLKPLRAHIPWTFTTANNISAATGNKTKAGPGWSYHGKYAFRAREFGLQFAARVRDVLNDEGIPYSGLQSTDFDLHIASRIDRDSTESRTSDSDAAPKLPLNDHVDQPKMKESREDETVVILKVKTHLAYIPEEILSLRPQLPATKDTPFPITLTTPGLTMRDVRFAMLVDEMFRNEYLKTGRGLESTQPSSLDYPSAQQMASNIFRQGFCRCCGLPHPLHQCYKRKHYPPAGNCTVCGGNHWVIDCSVLREKKGKKAGVQR
ncbi:hypothetical protein F5876DRAFT_61550 [Lentinula aff. lateritia]|uniref:Uncharacterized protein n=1 Tax=Lentinula aff. lateritia TaxID=2804960 RepID=A0ACC1UEC0_9AGAR|nr:hypothetical protein F5876DRAFT_61550 [Lentinula aff. lateritia]